MALSPAELKKLEKLEQMIEKTRIECDALKEKGANDIAKMAIKYDLWKVDKKIIDRALKTLAKEQSTI